MRGVRASFPGHPRRRDISSLHDYGLARVPLINVSHLLGMRFAGPRDRFCAFPSNALLRHLHRAPLPKSEQTARFRWLAQCA